MGSCTLTRRHGGWVAVHLPGDMGVRGGGGCTLTRRSSASFRFVCRSRMSLSSETAILLHLSLLLGCHGDITKKISWCLTECVDKVKT